MDAVIQTVIGTIIGGFITWVVARFYYVQASRELTTEADRLIEHSKRLRHLLIVIATALEEAGVARLVRDERGEITSVFVEVFASDGGTISAVESSTIVTIPVDLDKGHQDSTHDPAPT